MSLNVKKQLVSSIKEGGEYSLQIDESTDVSDDAQLLVYVRYLGENTLEEEFLFCRALETTTRGEDIFALVDSFMKEGLEWNNCSSICTDGAPAMLRSRKGFTVRVKEINPNVMTSHCFVQENLASHRLSTELGNVMQDVINIVNFIKSKSLNSRLFGKLCENLNAEHKHLIYFSNVRWLTRGKVQERFVTLRKVREFLIQKHTLADKLVDQKWLLLVAYLSDIFY